MEKPDRREFIRGEWAISEYKWGDKMEKVRREVVNFCNCNSKLNDTLSKEGILAKPKNELTSKFLMREVDVDVRLTKETIKTKMGEFEESDTHLWG